MDYRRKLYFCRNLYDHRASDEAFMEAVRENVRFHMNQCEDYARIMKMKKFRPDMLKTAEDLHKLPFLPTLFLKKHRLSSVEDRRMFIKATSSGTGGSKSRLGYELKGLLYGAVMVTRLAFYHKLLSPIPANYLLLGFEPHKSNETVITKTQFGSTLFAPALHREYALKYEENGYRLDLEGLQGALGAFADSRFPVRIVGFPAYLYFLLKEMQKDGSILRMPERSMILLGGGWKQFYSQKVDKEVLYRMAEETLGIREDRIHEFFGAAEHPALYCDCRNHHFHVSSFSRVIIRDVDTLKPLPEGKPGLINLITPMVESMPLVSVMTDDLGVLREGKSCGCGIGTPYLEIIGRVGVKDIKTCAAGAAKLLEG